MGAGNVLPVIPTFAAGSPALADLNNLSYAARFLIDHEVRPTWKTILQTTPGITASTWTVVPFTNLIFDSDGCFSPITPTTATIVTQGRYKLEACVTEEITGTKFNFVLAFKWVAGGSSPYSASSPAWFGYRGIDTGVSGSGNGSNAGCIDAITPFPCYPGDTLQVMVFVSAAGTLESNDNAGQPTIWTQGRVSTQFTGRWINSGS